MKKLFQRIILRLITPFLLKLPLKNIIVFESAPDYSDNTKYVFEELLRRNINQNYKLYWIFHNEESLMKNSLLKEENVYFLCKKDLLKVNIICCRAKAFLSCNNFLRKRRKDQYYLHLCHGAALKNCRSYSELPDYVDNVLTFSPFMGKYDSINFSCDNKKMLALGYPRNDILFENKIDIKKLFGERHFSKAIFWMPTYRQNIVLGSFSNISIPIIHDEESAIIINNIAEENEILIIVKPHFAQDVSLIKKMNLSNIVFIDNDFLSINGIENYELLRSVDALVSDYSSVYYDYLLTNKPIGLCFEDFEEYNKQEGFTVDPNYILSGGEKLYNTSDFCRFIYSVKNGKDVLHEERQKICKVVHTNIDNRSTQRVVDYILTKI